MEAVRFESANLHRVELHTRLPFRYGITTMTTLPHVFLRTNWQLNDHPCTGLAAENLPPKWFTKDASHSIDVEIDEMLEVIQQAVRLAGEMGTAQNVFAFWLCLQAGMEEWRQAMKVPPLLAGLGTSLVERSLLDAFCRSQATTLARAVHENSLGIDLGAIHPELQNSHPTDWLPAAPLEAVTVRHTVGLCDPLFDTDIDPANSPDDGLPVTLEGATRAYGLRQFKLKLSGNPGEDEPRLERTFSLLDTVAPEDWTFSLDANENYASAQEFCAAWSRLSTRPWMQRRLTRLLFVEQPVRRADALTPTADWRSWPDAPPLIIDESDGEPNSLRTALGLGYRGVSHKNCKGVFRGLANSCLLRSRRTDSRGRPLFMSGEDLANLGPVALQQDLAVQALLGNRSVERNGHHYFRGLSMWPPAWRHAVMESHVDLYQLLPGTTPTLHIAAGCLNLHSVNTAPFGLHPALNFADFCAGHLR